VSPRLLCPSSRNGRRAAERHSGGPCGRSRPVLAPARAIRKAARPWHPACHDCSARRTVVRPSPDTASLAGHDCAPSGTVVAPGLSYPIACHDCSARRTVVRPSPDTASLSGHCVPRRTRLCPERHSRGTRPVLPDRVPRLFGSANSRASLARHCFPQRTLRPSPDTTVPRAAQSWHPACPTRSRATTVRLGEQSCVPRPTLLPSADTASLAGHDCAPSGTVVAPGASPDDPCGCSRPVRTPARAIRRRHLLGERRHSCACRVHQARRREDALLRASGPNGRSLNLGRVPPAPGRHRRGELQGRAIGLPRSCRGVQAGCLFRPWSLVAKGANRRM